MVLSANSNANGVWQGVALTANLITDTANHIDTTWSEYTKHLLNNHAVL